MWNDKAVSVVLMTFAERDSIRAVIDGFFATGVVDEVVVVDNNASPARPRRWRSRGRGSSTSRCRATVTPPAAASRRRAAT